MRAAALAVVLVAGGAWAEAPSSLARGHWGVEPDVQASVGPRAVTLAASFPTGGGEAACGAELAWWHADRVVEGRVGRAWRLLGTGAGRLGAFVTGSALLVPGSDAGLGPHAGLVYGVGNDRLRLDLGFTTGAEFFLSGLTRLPQRLQVGLWLRVDRLTVGLVGRVGADVEPGHAFVGRADAALVLGWSFDTAAPKPTWK